MKVLVTGSAGFIGAHTVEHLLKNTDWDIVGIDSFRHKGDPMRHIDNPRFTHYAADLTAPLGRLTYFLEDVDYILNIASQSHVDRSIEDPVPFIENNVKLTLNMLELARHIKPKVFIQVSTDEVYGPAPEGTNHAEWSTILPSNPYSASKAAQEAIAISYWRTYGVPVVITNTMNNFGERQDPEKFVPMLIRGIEAGETVTIHGSDTTIGSRFYLHARNHADALLFLLKHQKPAIYGVTKIEETYSDESKKIVDAVQPDRYNIVGDVELNNLGMAKVVAAILGKPLNYKLVDFHKTRPGHDPRYALDGSKLKSLGWEAPVDFTSSLAKTVDWTMSEGREWLR